MFKRLKETILEIIQQADLILLGLCCAASVFGIATSIAVPVCSQQRVIGCLNLVYIASAMTIEQAAQKHLPALQRVARQIEARMEEEEVWYEMP